MSEANDTNTAAEAATDLVEQAGGDAPAKAPKGKAAPKSDGLVEATVARGCVIWDNPAAGKAEETHKGGTVRLPADEVARLRADRVLVDPDAPALPPFEGPTVSNGE
ncbi:MAG: hypothetical protein JSR98_20070 [Proteobacteria bacterium]|nr:hypothetical protein [Pseudomonadota bacterium]